MVESNQQNKNKTSKRNDLNVVETTTDKVVQIQNIKHEYTYDDVLNIIGFGRVQKKIMTMSALMILMNMNELMGVSVITIVAHCDLKMNNARKGVVHASALWGKILSSFFLGYLSDKLGRRPLLIYTTLMANVFSFLSMLMPNFWSFVCFRFLMGASAGGIVSITITYLGEFLTPNQRPFLMNYVNISNGVSYVYTAIVAYIVLEMDWNLKISSDYTFRPWRLLIFFNLLPGFIAVLILKHFPESPKLLLALGKHEEAFQAADWACRQNNEGRSLNEFQVYQVTDVASQKSKITCKMFEGFVETFELFRGPHVWNFLVCCIILTGAFSISFGLGLWYPVIQNDLIFYGTNDPAQTMCIVINEAKNETENIHQCDDHIANTSLLEDFGYGAISIVCYIFLGMLISTIRRKLIIMFLLGLGGCCGLALIKLTNDTLIVIFFSFYLVFVDLAASTLTGYMVDLIPTRLCAQASCLALTIGRISASLTTYIIGIYLQTHCTETFLIFAQLILVCAIFAHFLSPKLITKKNDESSK